MCRNPGWPHHYSPGHYNTERMVCIIIFSIVKTALDPHLWKMWCTGLQKIQRYIHHLARAFVTLTCARGVSIFCSSTTRVHRTTVAVTFIVAFLRGTKRFLRFGSRVFPFTCAVASAAAMDAQLDPLLLYLPMTGWYPLPTTVNNLVCYGSIMS